MTALRAYVPEIEIDLRCLLKIYLRNWIMKNTEVKEYEIIGGSLKSVR